MFVVLVNRANERADRPRKTHPATKKIVEVSNFSSQALFFGLGDFIGSKWREGGPLAVRSRRVRVFFRETFRCMGIGISCRFPGGDCSLSFVNSNKDGF